MSEFGTGTLVPANHLGLKFQNALLRNRDFSPCKSWTKLQVPIIVLLISLVVLTAFLTPKPDRSSNQSSLIYANGWVLRSLSGFAHNLVGDYLWLASSQVSEVALLEKTDDFVLKEVIKNQIISDPHFTTPAIYAATYLASISKRNDYALEVLHLSQKLNPLDFNTLFAEAMIRISYSEPNSSDRIYELARTIERLPDSSKHLGMIKVDDYLIEMIAYARTNDGKEELIRADLEALLSATTNDRRKELIRSELDKLTHD